MSSCISAITLPYMVAKPDEELLVSYFQEVTGSAPTLVTPLCPHASQRRIYRLTGGATSMVGVLNPDRGENDAFVYFARYFRSAGLPVPEIYLYRPEAHAYLEQDLGDDTLLDNLTLARERSVETFPSSVEDLYRTALEYLPQFQIKHSTSIDFSRCYPSADFSLHALSNDLESFQRELVLRLLPAWDLRRMQGDLSTLLSFLAKAVNGFFLYRDFQARNIMIVNNKPFFIDFQGGRKGPLQYDVVSLLYQSSAKIPHATRESLLNHYCQAAAAYTSLDQGEFLYFYQGFIISRMLQVLGVYGREGLGAGKEYFVRNIPLALETLKKALLSPELPITLPGFLECTDALIEALKRETP